MKIQKRLQKRKQKKPLPTIGTELHAARYHPNFTGRQRTPVISVHSVTGMSRSGPPGRLGSGFALGWAEGLSPLPLSLGPPLAHGLPHGHDYVIIAWLFSILPCFFPLSRAEIDESSGDFGGKMVEGAKNRQQDAPCCRFCFPLGLGQAAQPFWPRAKATLFSSRTLTGTLASREACQASAGMLGK